MKRSSVLKAGVLIASVPIVLGLPGCGADDSTASQPSPAQSVPSNPTKPALVLDTVYPKVGCSSLAAEVIPSTIFQIASGAATITSATLVAPSTGAMTGVGTSAIWQPAKPEFCKVIGTIAPVDPTAPLINFQINLPTAWNQRAAQLGGSGLNGSIPPALNTDRNAPESQPVDVGGPLSKGYITLGSDGGHQGFGSDWLLNQEAVTNYAYGEMKKTHDVAVELANQYFGQKPKLFYWFGSSQGGRQALMMAQNFPEDYDGIIAQVPAINLLSLSLVGTVRAQMQTTADTWIPPTKQTLIENEVLRQCDALDGIADGVISDYEGCNMRFINPSATAAPWAKIRCATGTDEGTTCLSDAQIGTLNAMHSDIHYGYDLAYGAPGYAAYGVGPSGQTWLGEYTMPTATYSGGIFPQFWKALITGTLTFAQMTWDPANWKNQFVTASTNVDALNPDLSRFLAHGGKLILKANSGDQTANYRETIRYYNRVVGVMGQEKVDSFLRFFVAPGLTHSMWDNTVQKGAYGDAIPSQVDMVDYLDKWAVSNQVPPDSIMLAQKDPTPPFATISSKPMCQYPLWPRFEGSDPTKGTSWNCTK
ncbi:tannase/feruloyl esterase family alpha/beta hydrolase [Cupriavidus sp. UYPR2.512]|uniref:tannase/feruloyl esterase family alpha/beta hydrolase n=1 Tax=Cupriavidus sp. UYPR2.512 TaxID=1080187 RepID=UPI0003AAB57F|nr:tannase/feruloyl esterase family alpha/beta hydrolase [Cupriavidus sp. UYPR2.512]UIF90003.1 tannase/feruloyl esterase family alpha/beta hydrolase [Cupriavidus necator]